MKRPRVLVAEDNDLIRAIIVEVLCEEFQVVDAVTDGEKLLESASSLHPDAIVSDISMARIDGFAAREELIAQRADLPFIFVSGLGKEVVGMFPADSPVAFVHKAEIMEHLVDAVKSALSGQCYFSPFYRV